MVVLTVEDLMKMATLSFLIALIVLIIYFMTKNRSFAIGMMEHVRIQL